MSSVKAPEPSSDAMQEAGAETAMDPSDAPQIGVGGNATEQQKNEAATTQPTTVVDAATNPAPSLISAPNEAVLDKAREQSLLVDESIEQEFNAADEGPEENAGQAATVEDNGASGEAANGIASVQKENTAVGQHPDKPPSTEGTQVDNADDDENKNIAADESQEAAEKSAPRPAQEAEAKSTATASSASQEQSAVAPTQVESSEHNDASNGAAIEDENSGKEDTKEVSLRDHEQQTVGADILFHRESSSNYSGWDNLRWMSLNGVRKISHSIPVYRYFRSRKILVWGGPSYEPRKLLVYREPQLMLLVRAPTDIAELALLLDEAEKDVPKDAMKHHLVVESVVDPYTSKLRLSPLTTATSIDRNIDDDNHRRRSCFELISPSETIGLSAVRLRNGAERALTSFDDSGAYLETSSAEFVVQQSMCNAHAGEHDSTATTSDMSWKHQIILGTLHSYVIAGDIDRLRAAVSATISQQKKKAESSKLTKEEFESLNYVDPKIIDAVDEQGRTPLHYACSSRNSKTVAVLVRAGADVNLKIEATQSSPVHLSASHLDFISLETLLSASKRPNVLDNSNRTPMYLAATEGRSVGNSRDAAALDKCLTVLKASGGTFFFGRSSDHKHPVSKLAYEWQFNELAIVLKHVAFRYPLRVANQNDKSLVGISVSAMYQYPVHQVVIALRKMVQHAAMTQTISGNASAKIDSITGTFTTLFKCGFEPNERIEGLPSTYLDYEELVAHVGFSPLQIVVATALDIEKSGDDIDANLRGILMGIVGSAAEVLVKFGARPLDVPPIARPVGREKFPSSLSAKFKAGEMFDVDRPKLKMTTMKQMEEVLGGSLAEAQSVWIACKSTESCGTVIIHQDNKSPIEDSQAPGGSDEKSCYICWKAFGTLMNRKHRCRVTWRHICDECSSKRVSENGTECRVTDGQFTLAQNDLTMIQSAKMEQAKRTEQQRQQTQQQQQQQQHKQGPHAMTAAAKNMFATASNSMRSMSSTGTTSTSTEDKLKKLEENEAAQRDTLFGDVMQNMTKAVFGDDNVTDQTNVVNEEVGGLASRLGQTRDALNQRGEKLNTLAEKSDRLVSASEDFASMAKELNRKTQNQGLFW
mmetsp:Transcript_4322/g.12384  ORF Transcript_4322/g.12384 Transcript_4322/m.12384 type:complete len:1102 (-) Transcript_4322:280-3585(-)